MIACRRAWLIEGLHKSSGNLAIYRDPSGFFARHQMRRRASSGLLLEIDVGERVAVRGADDVALRF